MASYQESSAASSSSNWQSSTGGTLAFYNQGMQSLLGQGQQQAKTPFQAYSSPLVAGATPMQQQAYGQAQGNVGNWQPLTGQAQGALSQLGTAGQFDQSQVQQYLNPYLNGVVGEIGRVGNEQFQNQVLPGLTGNFSALGQQGSARQAMMMSDAAARNQREVLGQQSTALNTGYNNAMQSYLNWAKLNSGNLQSQATGSASLAGNVQQYGNTDVGTLNTLGGQQQATQQKQLEADYGQFQRQQQYPWEQLNNWGSLFKVGTPTSTSSSGGSSSTSANTGWSTAFKKGGLASYADGGEAQSDDLVQQQLNKLRDLSAQRPAPQPSAPQDLATQAFEMRKNFMNKVASSSRPVEEPPMMMQLGEALLRGSAAGPGNLGQVLGRSGTAFFDAQLGREAENNKREMARLAIEERALPNAPLRAPGSLGGASGKMWDFKVTPKGLVRMNMQTGESELVDSSDPRVRAQVESQLVLKAIDDDIPNPEQWAKQMAARLVPQDWQSASPVGQGPTTGVSIPSPSEVARRKTFTTGSEELAMKDYTENIAPAAKVAESVRGVVDTIKQIPYTQDMFAPWREKVGQAFDALGMDGKMVREAQNIKQVMPLLTKLANDRLLLAKGVQTEGDAQRAFNEFVKITDPKEAADFLYKWTSELANRAKFKNELYQVSKDREKSWQKGEDYWRKSDYSQTSPMAIFDGKPWSFSEWRDKFLAANKKSGATIGDAIVEWNKLTRSE